jgi:predicted membrane protein
VILRAIDKILIAHRNTKLFFIMMSGPFFVISYLFKYVVKGAIFYYLYLKAKAAKNGEPAKTNNEAIIEEKNAVVA